MFDLDKFIYHPAGRIQVRNDSGQTIPAFGIMRITGSEVVERASRFIVSRPDGTYRQTYLVNGPRAIESGRNGTGYFATQSPVWALWDSGSDTPAVGDMLAPIKDSFKLTNYGYGFRVVGKNETSPFRIVMVLQEPPQGLYVQLNEDLAYQDSATAKVLLFEGMGTTTDSVMTVEVYDGLLESAQKVVSGAKMDVVLRGGKWLGTAAKCSDIQAA